MSVSPGCVSVVAEKGEQKKTGGEYSTRRFFGDLTPPDQIAAKAADVQQQIETVQHQAAALQTVTQEQLGQYVAEQAMSGLFKKVAEEELSIRESWDENNLIRIFEN